MSNQNNIHYLPYHKIDKVKWDNSIAGARNGLIYAYSFYLDHMAKHWDALIVGDYETVMPLPWNKKYGIKYLYQPFLTAQLGIFGNNITTELVDAFIKSIPSSFRLTEISLNSGNPPGSAPKLFSERSNYILDLDKSYDDLYNNYNENIQRNIKKATDLSCVAEIDFDVDRVIKQAVKQMKTHTSESAENVANFRKLYQYLHDREMAICYAIRSNTHVLSSCVFFFSHHRAYYILVGNNPKGKTTGASHALIDAFIRENAGKKMLLDFEGSDIPGLALFYSSFGAAHETYPALKINKLPSYLKWVKK